MRSSDIWIQEFVGNRPLFGCFRIARIIDIEPDQNIGIKAIIAKLAHGFSNIEVGETSLSRLSVVEFHTLRYQVSS